MLSAAGEQQAGEEPRRKYEIGIRDKSAPDHRSGALVELVVHEIHVAFMQELSFVRQSETYRVLVLARARTFAALRKTGVFEIGALIGIEVSVDRIQGDDGGKERPAGAEPAIDEVPFRDELAAHSSVDGRANLRELHVELRGLDRRRRRGNAGFRLTRLGSPDFSLFLGDGFTSDQVRGTFRFLQRQLEARLGDRLFSLRATETGIIGSRVDREQRIALLHNRSILEVDRLEVAADPSADLHDLGRLQTCGVLIPLQNFPLNGVRHGHLRRSHGHAPLFFAGDSSEWDQNNQQSTCGPLPPRMAPIISRGSTRHVPSSFA